MMKKDNFTQKLLICSQFSLTLFKLWGQFVGWCIIFVNPKGYCRWMLWRRTALAKNDSGVCGKVRNRGREEHRWSLLGVTRMYMRRSCCCVAECQYGCVQNNVEVTVALGHVLMLWILYNQYLPPTMSSLKYETFRSHLVNKVLRSSYIPSQCLPSLVQYGWECSNSLLVYIITNNVRALLALVKVSSCGCEMDI